MHLVSYDTKLIPKLFYEKRAALSRSNSLPYIFRRLRIHRNLTRTSLGKKFGVSEEYVSQIENGSKFPSLRFCLLCGQEFGANPNWVKGKWADERVERFKRRVHRRLGLD